jgi:hypothetical protein
MDEQLVGNVAIAKKPKIDVTTYPAAANLPRFVILLMVLL